MIMIDNREIGLKMWLKSFSYFAHLETQGFLNVKYDTAFNQLLFTYNYNDSILQT